MKRESEITCLAVTRDGTKIVSSDDDADINVWDVESHLLVKECTRSEYFPKLTIFAR